VREEDGGEGRGLRQRDPSRAVCCRMYKGVGAAIARASCTAVALELMESAFAPLQSQSSTRQEGSNETSLPITLKFEYHHTNTSDLAYWSN
jgi:hypothetical protein